MRWPRLLIVASLFLASADVLADEAKPQGFAIASAHPLATEAGIAILRQGGNAFDAAAAVTAALAVVEPYSSGIGGGGFYLLHEPGLGDVMVDARERAPLAADRDMYLDSEGEVVPKASMDGAKAAGIPGIPAAIDHLVTQRGRLSLERVLAPAIRLARDGFLVDERYRKFARFRRDALAASPAAAATFLFGYQVPPPGHLIRQPALAVTLERLAREGKRGFYEGPTARLLVNGVRQAGGIWQPADLQYYEIKLRQPVRFEYKGMTVTSASPPSSGGVAMATILNVLSGMNVADLDDADYMHTVAEAMRAAYRDRAKHLGDPDHVTVPVEHLTSTEHADAIRSAIDSSGQAARSQPAEAPDKGTDTTHFSVMDADGNRVSATLSINYPFGSAFMVPGTGVLLNDEMDDFVSKPGVANAYGLVGSEANAIAPGKRMLSSMSPTFIETDDRIAVVGTPGGSRIITMVLLAALDFARGGNAASMVSVPRFHHQHWPDQLQLEKDRFKDAFVETLKKRGYEIRMVDPLFYGNMQAVVWDKASNQLEAASDPRGSGMAAVCSSERCNFTPADWIRGE